VAHGIRDPADHGRVVADAIAHLVDLDRTRVSRSFGSPKAVQHLVRRADRGRPFVAFPATFGDQVLRLVLHEGPWIAGAIGAFVLVKLFVLDVNVIPSSSMVPTLLEDDRVVVMRVGWGKVPERWRVHTFQKHGVTYVKRVVGLPGERFAIVNGDAWADGKILRKPDDVREALRSPYWRWDFGGAPVGGWVLTPAEDGAARWRYGWHLPAHGLPEPEPPTGGQFALRDVYVELDVERPPEGRVSLELGRGYPLLRLEQGEPSPLPEPTWSLTVGPGGVRLGGWDGAPPERPGAPAGAIRLSLSYVDGVLRANVGDVSFVEDVPAPDGPARISFVVGGGARPLSLRLDKDLHYSYGQHTLGVPAPYGDPKPRDYAFPIPRDAVFCLGDNTENSTDSRNVGMGAIPIADVIGPVCFRLWPPARIGPVR
jgi:signal peptidase I